MIRQNFSKTIYHGEMRNFQNVFVCIFLIIFSFNLASAQYSIAHVDPPNWWTGMKNPNLQLLVHGNDIASLDPVIKYDGVSIEQVIKVQNPNYLFINLLIGKAAKPGSFSIDFKKDDRLQISHKYQLLAREPGASLIKGFNNSDVMYLITPDRFANGDPGNDSVEGMLEKANRSFKGGRHGGDIKGMIDHLDYIADMGYTAIWLNPVLENDQPEYSYHGYATTDFYQVDARFGSNEEFRQLVSEGKKKGIRIIMDMIVNHCGSEHWWMKDLPTADWLNFQDQPQFSNHQKSVIQDPHVADVDHQKFVDGWFVETMPDLNQRNPLMANYLIQNTLWWIEYSGVSGIRMDTYPYPDMDFMADWTMAVMDEYPDFNIVGEEWNLNPAIVAYWQKGKNNPNGYTSELKSLMDFPLNYAMINGLKEEESWGKGFLKMYDMLANDFLYADTDNLVIFPDNHDMPRFYAQVGENYDLFRMGIAYVLTMRGIPQIYYGTEILMSSPTERDDGLLRGDYPGGWKSDKVNAFEDKGLTELQAQAKAMIKKLLNWRKKATVIHSGKLIHYLPENGIYVYFRYNETDKVMVILNKNEAPVSLELARFDQMLNGMKTGRDVLSGKIFNLDGKSIELSSKAPLILELK